MPSSHGGKREGAGRPALGTTRKVSITLPDEEWKALETAKGGLSMSAYLREIIKGRN
ncbi:CopG family transcriptional regulator [Campylobacter sp. 1]|nr:CopG family transcriptional regulator [Campylobacter sp. 1]